MPAEARWGNIRSVDGVSSRFRLSTATYPDDGGLFFSQLTETGRDQGHVMSLGGGVVGMAMRVRAESAAIAVTTAEAWMLDNTSESPGTWRIASSIAFRLGGEPDPARFLSDRVIPRLFEKWADEVEN